MKNRWHLINRYSTSTKNSNKPSKNVKHLSAELNTKLLASKSVTAAKGNGEANEKIFARDTIPSLNTISVDASDLGEKVLRKRIYCDVSDLISGDMDISHLVEERDVVDSIGTLDLASLYHTHYDHCHDFETNYNPSSNALSVPANVSIWERSVAPAAEFAAARSPKPFMGHKYKKLRILHLPVSNNSNDCKQLTTSTTTSATTTSTNSPDEKDAAEVEKKPFARLMDNNDRERKQLFNTATPVVKAKVATRGFEHQWIDDFLSSDSNPASSSAESPFSENLKSMSIIHDEQQEGAAHGFPSLSLPSCNGKKQRNANLTLSKYQAADRSLMLLDINVDDEADEFSGLSISEQSFCFSPTPLSICELTHPLKSSRPGSAAAKNNNRLLSFPIFSSSPIFRFPVSKLFSSSAPSPVNANVTIESSRISEKENLPDN